MFPTDDDEADEAADDDEAEEAADDDDTAPYPSETEPFDNAIDIPDDCDDDGDTIGTLSISMGVAHPFEDGFLFNWHFI